MSIDAQKPKEIKEGVVDLFPTCQQHHPDHNTSCPVALLKKEQQINQQQQM